MVAIERPAQPAVAVVPYLPGRPGDGPEPCIEQPGLCARRPGFAPVRTLPVDARTNRLEFLGCSRRADEVHPIGRRYNRGAADWPIVRSAETPRETAPLPVLSPPDLSGPQGIALDMAHDRRQLPILLDRKYPVLALPDTPVGVVPRTAPMRRRRQEPVHPPTDVAAPPPCALRNERDLASGRQQASRVRRLAGRPSEDRRMQRRPDRHDRPSRSCCHG